MINPDLIYDLVETDPGKSSTFTISLSALHDPQAAQTLTPSPAIVP
jgi:hypothetical protein